MKKLFLVFIFYLIFVFTNSVFCSELDPKIITWYDLRKLNYETGEIPDSIKNLIGKSVKIPGFAVPLEEDEEGFEFVKEFLLVPVYGMCIHVPPPPPNQMIFIKLNKPEKVRYMYQPIAVVGILKNTPPIKNVYNSIYEMNVETIEDIDFEDLNY